MVKNIVDPSSTLSAQEKSFPLVRGYPAIRAEGQNRETFTPSFSQLVRSLGFAVSLIGLGMVARHYVSLPWLHPGNALVGDSLSPISVGLLFLGFALLSILGGAPYQQKARWLQMVSYGSLLISGGIGLYFVLLHLSSARFNLLNLFVQNTPEVMGVPSFISALSLLLCATILYIAMSRSRSEVAVVYFVGVPAIFIWNLSLLALFSYSYDLPVLYNFNMTVTDSLAYFAASIAILLGTISLQGLLKPLISPVPKVRWMGFASIALGLLVLIYGVSAIAQLIEPSRILEELVYRRSYVSFLLATIGVAMLTKTFGLRSAQSLNRTALYVRQMEQGLEQHRVIQQILQAVRSSLHLPEIFEKIVVELGMNLEADRCFITRYQESSQQLSPPSREYLSSDDLPTMIGTEQKLAKAPGWLEKMVAQAKPIDFDPDTPGFYPEITAYLKEIQVQCGIACAITYQGQGLAILFIHQCHHKRIWTVEEKKLIQTAAGQLGVAIHQANRFEASQVQANQQKGVAELSQRGLLGIDITILIDQAVELVAATLKMDHGHVLEYLPEQNAFRLASGHGLVPGLSRHETIDANIESQAGYTLASHKAVIVNNFEAETRFTGMPFLQAHQVMSCMTVTIYSYAHEKPYGVLGIYSKEPRWFSEDDIHFVEAIANVLGMAIERKQSEAALQISKQNATIAQTNAEELQASAEASRAIAEAAQALAEAAQANAEEVSQALAKSEELLRKYAAELEQSNLDLEHFAMVASHDLQAPLRKVQIFSQQLQQDEKHSLRPESQDLLNRIQGSIQSMQALIDDLLTLARITKGKTFEPVDLTRLLLEVKTDLAGQIHDTQAQIEIGSMCTVDGDMSQLRQLFQNLLENSLKYRTQDTPPKITISSNITNESCEIKVKDNGIGFDQKYAVRIFGIFERLHGKSTYQGTGIGLAICKRVVERHSGTIRAVSEQGKGATFIVQLPLKAMLTTK